MGIFINRSLNMRRIKAIGFDMDHTLVRYHTEQFEKFAYYAVIEKLISLKNYPALIKDLKFDFERVIQGLVLDIKRGNILKLSRFGKVKNSYHGTQKLDFNQQKEIYLNQEIDPADPHMQSLDTSFSASHGVLFSQLVDIKDQNQELLPSYSIIADDIKEMLDLVHRDGTLKDEVRNNVKKYIIKDPELPHYLENYKEQGKKLMIITNSDYKYTKLLMDYAFNPFLQQHKDWTELFDITITLSFKPHFFTGKSIFLSIDPKTALMSNTDEKISKGIFQGGNAKKLMRDLNLEPSEILYIGDHIYGDVLSLKKSFNWRTALVFAPLQQEIDSIKKGSKVQEELTANMETKCQLEQQLTQLNTEKYEKKKSIDKEELNDLYNQLDKLNTTISAQLEQYHQFFNPYWGEQMRAGYEESMLAGQIEKYACIYVAKVADLFRNSPRSFYRPFRRVLPHERL